MFLWAKLVMEYINKNLFYHRDEILKAAISLPRELGEFYGRMLSQIMANFDERSAQRISAVLSWIAFAKRPLRLAELLSALTFDTKQEQVDELVPAYILDRCEPLIQKQADSSYSFVHVSVRDFLQSSDTTLLIMENESQMRHGLATVRCLLSGQQILAPLYPDSEKTLRVLHGLHGFHMYATEFWADYLLTSLEVDRVQFFESDFFALSCRLAKNFIAAETNCEAPDGSLSDPRLALIRQKDYCLYKMVKVVLLEQNKETLEVTTMHGDTIQHDDMARDIIALKKSLIRHEVDHSKHICRVQGCQYPVFTSAKLLKNHMAEHHTSRDQRMKRKSIRKRPALVGLSRPKRVTYHDLDPMKMLDEEFYSCPIKCICGSSEDNGENIYCDTCDTKQHIDCFYPENREEVFQEDFSHSCADCKPLSQTTIQRNLHLRNTMLLQKEINEDFRSPSQRNISPHPPATNVPRQATPSVVQPIPPPIVAQNSQMNSQMMEDVRLITEEGVQRMESLATHRKRVLQQQAHQQARQQAQQVVQRLRLQGRVAVAQLDNRPHEGQGNGIEPKLDHPMTVFNHLLFDNDENLNDDKLLNRKKLFGDEQTYTDESFNLLEFLDKDKLDNPGFANNSSSEPSLATAASSEVFNQRISATNSQHLNAMRNSPSSSTSRDASPFRQSSPLASMPPHDSRTSGQEPSYFRDQRDFEDYYFRGPRNRGDYFYTDTRGTTSQTQQHKISHALGGHRPPTPPPPPAPPLKAADLQSTLTDYTSANKTPHPYRQAPYIGSSATELPYGFTQASSSPPTLPPLELVERACANCVNRNIHCDGMSPCYNCLSAWLTCSFLTMFS
ncbi:transcriptional regulator family: Fungal Specific TF [Trichoderma harzianum]|nr:transcriptional regulator family: Fungal Specific TF [Trichoderma harzianum]